MSSVDLDETIVRPFRIRSSVRRNVREVVRRFVGQDVSLFDEQPANSDALVELLSAALLETMASAARWVDRYSVALERLRPRMLVSTTFSSIPGRAAAGVARGIGAVTVYLQHGLLPAEPYVTSHCHDYKLVWGDQDRRLLLHHGHSPESVAVVGSTLYDDLVQRTTAASRPFPMQDEPLDVLFFASRTGGAVVSQATAERTLRTAALVVQGMDNIRLTVKVHPADGTDLPESVLGDEPNVRVVRAGRSADLVQKTDLVLITSSTTGFEACIADRPLIILNLTGSTEVTQLVDAGAALEAHSATELKACIEELRANPAARDKLARGRVRVRADRLGGAHGDAARRAADFLARLDRAPAA